MWIKHSENLTLCGIFTTLPHLPLSLVLLTLGAMIHFSGSNSHSHMLFPPSFLSDLSSCRSLASRAQYFLEPFHSSVCIRPSSRQLWGVYGECALPPAALQPWLQSSVYLSLSCWTVHSLTVDCGWEWWPCLTPGWGRKTAVCSRAAWAACRDVKARARARRWASSWITSASSYETIN